MAGPSVIGALRVVLGADTAALDRGLKDSQSKLASFGAGMATAGVAVATAVAAMGAAVAVAVKSTINEADNLGKMAQKIGVPVEELSALKYAAELSDVSLESLGKSLGKLSKTMVEAATKPTSEAANAFRALGVSVVDSDGKLKTSSHVTADIAEKFEGLKDGAGKTAVAMALFGRSGAEMIPLLNTGKAGIKEMAAEAAKLGIVMDKQTTKSAEEFNDNLKRLSKVQDGIILQITAGMLPALKNFSANLVGVAKDADLLRSTGELLGGMLTGMLIGVARVSLAWNRLGVEWAAFRVLMKTDIFSGNLTENWEKFNAVGEESKRMVEALQYTMETAHLADAFGIISTKAAATEKPLKDFNFSLMGGKNALDQFLDSQKKSLAAQQAEFAATDMATGTKERLRLVLQGLTVAQANSIVLTDALRIKLTEAANAAELMGLKLGNVRLIGETNPFGPIMAQLDAVNLKLQEGGLSAQDYAVLSGQAAQLTQRFWADSATSIGNSFESIGSSMSQMSDNWARFAKIGQAIGAAVAFVNAYIAASQAFATTLFPANIAIAAGVLAKGMAMVAAIKGAVPKMASGGTFDIPGGIGGADKYPVNFMAQAGERVKVEPNRYGEGSSGETRTVVVQGLNPREWFRGDIVRDFAEGLMGANRDGLQIKFT